MSGPTYWNPHQAQPETILPSNYQEVRASAGDAAWGDWFLVEATLPAQLILLAAHVSRISVATSTTWFDIGIDPLGGTSYVSTCLFGEPIFIAGSGAAPIHQRTYRLPPLTVPAGASIAVRGYKTAGHAAFQVYLSCLAPPLSWYTPWPNTYIKGQRVIARLRIPTVPGWVTVPVGSGWTHFGDTGPYDSLLDAAELDPFAADGGVGTVVEIALGPYDSEVLATRIPFASTRIYTYTFGYQEAGRKAFVPPWTRLSARVFGPAYSHKLALYFDAITP